MFNRVRVISGLLGVLALFVLLQLVSGSAFFNTVKADKENFAYNQRLATLQQAMGTSWVSLVQARNTLNRAGIRYLLDSQQAGSGATVQDLVALANQELKVADQGFADFNANLSEKGKTAENVLTLQANYKAYRDALDSDRFDIAAGILYEFTWNQFCDWYLELAKPVMNGGTEAKLRGTRNTLVTVLEALLRLAHPIIPFITETIWQRVKVLKNISDDTIMLQPMPEFDAARVDEVAMADTEWLKQAIVAVRNIRNEMNISPAKPLDVLLRGASDDAARRVNENHNFLKTLARLDKLELLAAGDKGPVSVTKLVDGAELLIPMAELVDKNAELERLAKEVGKIDVEMEKITAKLGNEGFVARAPEAVVAKERERLADFEQAKIKLIEQQGVIAAL